MMVYFGDLYQGVMGRLRNVTKFGNDLDKKNEKKGPVETN